MKVGLIGAGGVGSTRAGLVANTPGAELVFVADALPDRAARLAREYGAEAITDWRRVTESPAVDTVIVSASNDIHAPASIAALEAGKNVLCEKPLARTPDEAREVHLAAERTGLTLKTGFNHRALPGRFARPGNRRFGRAWLDLVDALPVRSQGHVRHRQRLVR